MPKDIITDEIKENINYSTSNDTNSGTDNEPINHYNALKNGSSVILGESENSSSTDDIINFDIDQDTKRKRINAELGNYQRISATYGYAILVENTALKLTLGNVILSARRLIGLKNSFLELNLVQNNSFIWNIVDEADIDNESTLVLKITDNSEFVGSINPNNSDLIGKVSVTVDDTSNWYLTKTTYIDELNITDNSRITLNDYKLFVNGRRWIQNVPEMISIDTGYNSDGVPTVKTLKVIKYQYLPVPEERSRSYIYFCYDRMQLYLYQSLYTDPFCIVEKMPEYPATDMLYITLEGKMYSYYGDIPTYIGEIEHNTDGVIDPNQLDILKQAGTVFFMNAEARYIDTQTRTVQLPFQNGNYILSLELAKNLKIDENTVIRYNPSTEQFYIAGQNYQYDDRLDNVNKYSGYTTRTAETLMDGHTFRTYVSISDKENNGLTIAENGGLYIDVSDLALQSDYEKILSAFVAYKEVIDNYMDQIVDLVQNATGDITISTINTEILNAFKKYNNDITTIIKFYTETRNRLRNFESDMREQIANQIAIDKQNIIDRINRSAWGVFSESDNDYTNSIENGISKTWSNEDKASILSWFRDYIRFYREEYEETVDNTDLFGLTEKERWLLEVIFNYNFMQFGSPRAINYNCFRYYSWLFDEHNTDPANQKSLYIVIDITGDNRVFQIYVYESIHQPSTDMDIDTYNLIYEADKPT